MSFHLKKYLFFKNILLKNNQHGGYLEQLFEFNNNFKNQEKYIEQWNPENFYFGNEQLDIEIF